MLLTHKKKKKPLTQKKAKEPTEIPQVTESAELKGEDLVVESVKRIIGAETVSPEDDIFELGFKPGDVIQLIIALKTDGLTAADIYKARTVSEITKLLETQKDHEPSAVEGEYMLTPYQIRYIKYMALAPGVTMGNMPLALRVSKKIITADQIADVAYEVFRSHPVVSTIIHENEDGTIVQTMDPSRIKRPEVRVVKQSDFASCSAELDRPFEMYDQLLYRCVVFDVVNTIYFYLDFHHIISDSDSIQVLLQHMIRVLRHLEQPEDRYLEYLSRQNKRAREGYFDKARQYMLDTYRNGKYTCIVPFDTEERGFHTSILDYETDFFLNRVKSRANGTHITIETAIAATAIKALHKFTGDDHILINFLFSGRDSFEKVNMVGLMLSALPLAVDFDADTDAAKMYESIEAYAKADLDYIEASPGTLVGGPFEKDVLTIHYTPYRAYGKEYDNIRKYVDVIDLINRNEANTNPFYIIIRENSRKGATIMFKYNDIVYKKESVEKYIEYFFEAAAELSDGDPWIIRSF